MDERYTNSIRYNLYKRRSRSYCCRTGLAE
nr:MAG TPA: hypothetical protein [Bacteriophage sp.]